MTSFIPKEQSAAYRPWRLTSLDGGSGKAQSQERENAERVKMINQQAYREGVEAGYAKGASQAVQEAARIASIADQLRQELAGLEQHVAGDLVRLALTLARALVRESLKVHPELVEAIVRESVRDLPPFNQGARIRLNPEDAQLIGKHLRAESGVEWTVIEDPTLARGGCRIETPNCEIDASIETRWQKLTAALAQEHDWIA
jgi:flagellar assembly protein FliH